MSSASIPVSRSAASSSASRHSLFWPVFVLMCGIGTLSLYQVMALEDQLDEVTRAVDKMDSKVKLSKHEEAMFYGLARDVLAMAPKDPNAEQIVTEFKIRQLKALKPVMFETPAPSASTNAPASDAATSLTNSPAADAPEIPDASTTTPAAAPAK